MPPQSEALAPKYNVTDHERAYKLHIEGIKLTKLAKEFNTNYTTIQRWASSWFKCPFGCPWHNWELLDKEKEKALKIGLRLAEEGKADELSIAKATSMVLSNDRSPGRNRNKLIDRINLYVRSDLHRVAHWEYLYGIVFKEITGIQLDPTDLVELEGLDPETIANAKHLPVGEFQKGVCLLQSIQGEIDKIRKRNTPIEDDIRQYSSTESMEEKADLTLDQLRRIANTLENAPGNQVNILVQNLRAEEAPMVLESNAYSENS